MSLKKMRNIGIMAHIDAGKTTTTERILYYTGKSHRMGEVDDGDATMDWMEQEQNRGITITAAATTCYWNDFQINIIDTPGHVDFTAEVERSLRVLDGAIAIFCAVGGVEPQSETVWRQADRYHVPRIGYINKMDRVGSDFFNVLDEIQEKLGGNPVPINIPIGSENNFEGVIDIINKKEFKWDKDSSGSIVVESEIESSRIGLYEYWKENLLDKVSSFSEEITDLYLIGEEVPLDVLKSAIRKATIEGKILPVLTGASLKNVGVQPLLDAVIDYLPAPDDVIPAKGHHVKTDKEVLVPCKKEGQPLGLVFKIQSDKDAGAYYFTRIYSGTFKNGSSIVNIGKAKKERVNRILRMHSNKFENIDSLSAGDIGVFIGLKFSQTGDTLGMDSFPILLEKMEFPEPVISIAIEPKTISDRDRLKEVLEILSKEDPTFSVNENEETGQLVISGMGELHLDVLVTRIIDDFKVEANIGNPQVSYRESVTQEMIHVEKFQKVIAGNENRAELTIKVVPAKRGAGNSLNTEAIKKEIPKEILEAITRGIEGSFNAGICVGYPIVDVDATVLSVNYSETFSTPFAFEAASVMGFDEACKKAAPILLEPIMTVDIMTPKEYVGDVISQVTMRGGIVESLESRSNIEHIKAHSPLVKMFGYSTSLRSSTQGRGTFSMEFSHFAKKN
ncbi:MAG: elongation factor G [Spirochaetaceae bacterium]|nr:elongation factor G [Spirochaetaceae bacterium]